MKFLLLAVLCFAAAAAYKEQDLEYALFEDAGILESIRERIKEGFEAALDRIKALIEKHKPAVENLKERLVALKEKVQDLLSKTGEKFREALSNIRVKIQELLRDVLKKITESAEGFALYDADDEPTAFQLLLQRIRERVQAAFERLKTLVAEHKEILTEKLKQQIENLKQKLAELALEHGARLLDKAREVAANIREVILSVIGKIGQKEESALYAIEEEGETFLQALKRRIIDRLQQAVEQIKDRLSQVKSDFAEKVLPKLQEIRDKIKQLAKESGEKLIVTAGQISQKIREILADVKSKILGEVSLYADDEDTDPTILQRIVKRLQERLRGLLDKVKELIANHKEIAENVKEKIETIKTRIVELAKEHGAKLRQTVRDIAAKIRELTKNVLEKIGGANYYMDIDAAAKALRDFFITDAGIAALKDNARNANPKTQTGQMMKAYIMAATSDALKGLVKELFKNISYAPVATYNDDIRALVIRAVAWLRTDAGIAEVRTYAKSLQTSHPIVLHLKTLLGGASNNEVRELIDDIFTISYY